MDEFLETTFMRLDKLIFIQGLTSSRQQAQTLITAGKVSVNGKIITKPSQVVTEAVNIEIDWETAWSGVSRGGLKLEYALQTWSIQPGGAVCLDVGASTGGFTEVLLNHGATKVYAVDVGHQQLAESLKREPRVVNLEGVNVRFIDASVISEPIDFCCIDVSFISLTLVLPPVVKLLPPEGEIVVLIKPQFEVGPAGIGKHGVVKDSVQHQKALDKIVSLATTLKWSVVGVIASPILGGEGNQEFLGYLRNTVNL